MRTSFTSKTFSYICLSVFYTKKDPYSGRPYDLQNSRNLGTKNKKMYYFQIGGKRTKISKGAKRYSYVGQ